MHKDKELPDSVETPQAHAARLLAEWDELMAEVEAYENKSKPLEFD